MDYGVRIEVLKGLKKNARIKYIGPDISGGNPVKFILKSGTYGYKIRNVIKDHRPWGLEFIANGKTWQEQYYRLSCPIIEVAERLAK